MAIYVNKSFKKHLRRNLCATYMVQNGITDKETEKRLKNTLKQIPEDKWPGYKDKLTDEFMNLLNSFGEDYSSAIDFAVAQSEEDTEEETKQAMEAVIHNFNTLHCLPAHEKIWVFDTEIGEKIVIDMETLHNSFKPGKFKAISLNKQTKQTELKYITAVEKKDNHRRLITLTDDNNRFVTTTDNHNILFEDTDGTIKEAFPEKLSHVLICNNETYSKSRIKTIEISNSEDEYVYDLSVEDNENFLTANNIFVHNSRAGAQVPFSSINFGTDTSPAGRLVIRKVLDAIDDGLGNGETAIFPISIFRIKEGLNYNPSDPNYDLFKDSMRISAKRLFPKQNWGRREAENPVNLQM